MIVCLTRTSPTRLQILSKTQLNSSSKGLWERSNLDESTASAAKSIEEYVKTSSRLETKAKGRTDCFQLFLFVFV